MEFLLLLALPLLFGGTFGASDEADDANQDDTSQDSGTGHTAAGGFFAPDGEAAVAEISTQPTDGNDHISLTNAREYSDALAGDDYIFGHNASDTLIGSAGRDTLDGGDGGDLLDGVSNAADGDGPDQLFGGKGVDTLWGDQGDSMAGGAKDDVFIVQPGGAPVVITDFMTEAQNPDPTSNGDSLYIVVPADLNARDMTDDLSTRDAANGQDCEVLLGQQVVAIVRGGAGQSIWPELFQGKASDEDWGTPGNDSLTGSSLADFVYGGDGADLIDSRGSHDLVHDGFGNDDIRLGSGNDVFLGADRDYGMADNDILRAGRGDDMVISALGADTLNGDAGNDWIDATDLEGQTGPQADRVSGGAGNDTLTGDAGDRLAGGSGVDEFHVMPGGMVTLPDFNPAEDEIILHIDRAAVISFAASGTSTVLHVDGQPMVTLQNILPAALSGATIRAA